MALPSTNIVVTCWNALEYTKVTLQSLFDTARTSYYLTIVDNGSRADTKHYLASLKIPEACKNLQIITNEENMGPGYAANQGFEVSLKLRVPFTCLCNNDLYFSNGWLSELESTALRNDKIAIVVPLRPTTTVKYDDTTSSAERLKQLGQCDSWQDELERFIGGSVNDFDDFAEQIALANGAEVKILSCPPDAVSTCCALIRNSIFQNEFGFLADPAFTHYGGEDSDMSWAVGARGYTCAVDARIYVHHFRSKSLVDNVHDRQSLIIAGNETFFKKWRAVIYRLIIEDQHKGIDLNYHLEVDRGDKYWFLQRLNRDIGFWRSGAIVESKFQ